jgi:uncharacterized protein
MSAALKRIRTVEITKAIRAAQFGGIAVKEGQPIALLDGELVAADDELETLMLRVLHMANTEDNEIVTLYYGSDIDAASAEQTRAVVRHEFPGQEIELHAGGQPLYPFIVSIE